MSVRFLWLLLWCLPLSSAAQENDFHPYTEINLGFSVLSEALREGYNYQPVTLLPATSLWHLGRFSAYAEGQLVYANIPIEPGNAYEFGINMGIRYHQPVVGPVYLTAAVGAGPHYITLETASQAEGFIFSDNFELGFSMVRPENKWGFNLRARFRHISNAGFKYPNLGIDNLFLVVGLRRKL